MEGPDRGFPGDLQRTCSRAVPLLLTRLLIVFAMIITPARGRGATYGTGP
ncbi:hypothetical protein [Arthrobacter sp. DR-2P]|nr:hypothetical protein [Arthrobacter sp. DR-2P]